MSLNVSKGNMYEFVTHTYNTVKGQCLHNCSYCYVKRWGKLNPVRFDAKELKTDLGSGNFIFVGSSCDMFSTEINQFWIDETLQHLRKFSNKYLFQTKNPARLKQMTERYIFPAIRLFAPQLKPTGFMQILWAILQPHSKGLAQCTNSPMSLARYL